MPGAQHLAGGVDVSRGGHGRITAAPALAVGAGSSAVSITVPAFAPCAGSAAGMWNADSGGIHLRLRGDCVPCTAGGMSTTLRVGVGRACGWAG